MIEGTIFLPPGSLIKAKPLELGLSLNRFHYRPSLVWPPLRGDGVEIATLDGKKRVVDDQIQMYW